MKPGISKKLLEAPLDKYKLINGNKLCPISHIFGSINWIKGLIKFKIKSQDIGSKARTGELSTAHGPVKTPIFMPVGTAGSVKAVHQRELENDIKAQIILGNTYHLYLRPGLSLIEKARGIHNFTGWKKPILTDSGGYQVYSLAAQRKIHDHGVTFRSHLDGSLHTFTPEDVIDFQKVIGADIIMAFDECTPHPCDYSYAKDSMKLTHKWLKRCVDHFNQSDGRYGYQQVLFPIVQGSTYKDLRVQSSEIIASFEMEGNAIGGLSVGESTEMMYEMTELVCQILPAEKPRYLMGVGTPANILECIALGIDMFDCVMPTRNGRNGMIFTSEGIINIKNEKWREDLSALDESLGDYTSTFYSKAYLRHLIMSKEILGAQIASIHNLRFYLWLTEQAGEQIENGTFAKWKNTMVSKLSQKL